MPETLSVAVCTSKDVTLSDFVCPMDILGGLNLGDDPLLGEAMGDVPYRVAVDYLSPTMDPVSALATGQVTVKILPTMTYKEAMDNKKQFDILWVPAGPLPDVATGKDNFPQDEIAFIAQQAPKAKYVMSVCTGAHQLAVAGVLSGRRATTNKKLFRLIQAVSPKDIDWVPQARWVIDGNVWTSSGVTAGSDMALAFLEHLTNKRIADEIRGLVEIPEVTQNDDPFAKIHGLV